MSKNWEIINYMCLGLCLLGQVLVGKEYLLAQIFYLVANGFSVTRDVKTKMPLSNIIRDSVFFGITLILIIIELF